MEHKKILIIDDDELNSTAFAKRLEKKGFKVNVLTDGNFAMNALETEHADLVILDIVMPNIDGLSLLKKIREKYSSEQLPVIMVTVIDDSAEIFDAFAAGANDYITKPVNIDAATSRIRGQLSAVELMNHRLQLKEIETLNALVVTYHHEINNPLTIARSELQLLKRNEPVHEKQLQKVYLALDRIADILKRIQEIAEKSKVAYDLYADQSKMLKVKK